METALIIVGIIALAAFSVLCVVAIRSLQRLHGMMDDVSSTLDETKRLAAELNKNLPQTFATVQSVSLQLNGTMQKVDTQLDSLGEGIAEFKAIGERVNTLEARLQGKIEKPLMQAASVVSGISKAITTFAEGVRRR